MKIKPNKSLSNIKPYELVSSYNEVLKDSEPLKLDWNEGTIKPPSIVIQKLNETISNEHLNWYADPECRELKQEIVTYTNQPVENILVTNGSDSGLELIVRSYLDLHDSALLPVPTYSNFEVFLQSTGCDISFIKFDSPFRYNYNSLKLALDDDFKLIYLVNPNNPTGALFSSDEIKSLISQFPTTLFVIDEAYFEFSKISMTSLINDFPNIIISRSFSKAFCLAGLRIGYLLAQEITLQPLLKIHNFKSINYLAQVAAVTSLRNLSYMLDYVQEVELARKWFCQKIKEIGLPVTETLANFVLIKFSNVKRVWHALAQNRLFVRDRSNMPNLEGYLRITIGTKKQMEQALLILKKTISE